MGPGAQILWKKTIEFWVFGILTRNCSLEVDDAIRGNVRINNKFELRIKTFLWDNLDLELASCQRENIIGLTIWCWVDHNHNHTTSCFPWSFNWRKPFQRFKKQNKDSPKSRKIWDLHQKFWEHDVFSEEEHPSIFTDFRGPQFHLFVSCPKRDLCWLKLTEWHFWDMWSEKEASWFP